MRFNQSVREPAMFQADRRCAEIHAAAIVTFGGGATSPRRSLGERGEVERHGGCRWRHAPGWATGDDAGSRPADETRTRSRARLPPSSFISLPPMVSPLTLADGPGPGMTFQKAIRMALAIGGDADTDMLRRFLNDERRSRFCRCGCAPHQGLLPVRHDVTARSRSANPNEVPQMEPVRSRHRVRINGMWSASQRSRPRTSQRSAQPDVRLSRLARGTALASSAMGWELPEFVSRLARGMPRCRRRCPPLGRLVVCSPELFPG